MAPGNQHPNDFRHIVRDAGVSIDVMMMVLTWLPALHDNSHPFVLQLSNAQTPMCWRPTEKSTLPRRGTTWATRPHMSATLDTQCVVHPSVCAYQMGSGAAPLPSVAVPVSPESLIFGIHPHWRLFNAGVSKLFLNGGQVG